MADECLFDYLQRRSGAMKLERSTFDPHWKDLAQFVQPRMSRFFMYDSNRGDKRYQNIINSRATQAHRSARAGLLAGVMSPTRPWFNLVTPDPDMMQYQPVTEWLYKVEQLIGTIFSSSNLYNMAPVMLGELLLFGTGAMSHVDDFEAVSRFYTHTVGSYSLAQNDRFEIDTMAREFQMTVQQMVDAYGSAVSPSVRDQYDRGNYDAWIPVGHLVGPNPNFNPRGKLSRDKMFRSVYWEPGSPTRMPLREAGFDEFPVHCPRWDVTGEDIYATDCPGMTTLGDVKALQHMERRKAQAIDKMVNPPLRGPASLRGANVSSLPGGLTVYDGDASGTKLEPLYTVAPQIQALVQDIEHHEGRIDRGYYVDLFRSIDSMEGVQPQNQLFLSMKNAERLLQLGPVLERLHGEFLNKMVDRTFAQCLRANLLPPAPPELQGQPLRARYISSLAMAQREVATVGIDKLTMYIGGLMQMGLHQAADKFDTDQAISTYAHAIGVPPRVLVPDDQVAAMRQQRAQQEQMAQKLAMAQSGANTAQMLANSPMPQDGSTVLSGLAKAYGQQATPK